ncbi:MAG TPA: DNA alkylation repair protein [Saprospiraceae bacterium]|nr:DNA alkylation repair protein [Saprospiraceae bacterium]HMP25899.1 DNA alkylation repair protein [Saprospiraceae bacterium]
MLPPDAYVQTLQNLYRQHANPPNAELMARYMKNQFAFFGLKKPERTALSEQMIAQYGVPEGADLRAVCQLCFEAEQREMQYFVHDLLGKKIIKQLDARFLELLESLMLQKSWWDSIDFLAPKLAGNILMRHPEAIARYPLRWIESDNIWLQRAAILFQLDYKNRTDAPLLFALIARRADSKEFFVQKAAGWALRSYSRFQPEAVRQFIAETPLSKLTVREGLKRLS